MRTAPLDSALLRPAGADRALHDEVLHGLLGTPKILPPKLFYDAEGARLFERICTLDEYYLTRAELEILESLEAQAIRVEGETSVFERGETIWTESSHKYDHPQLERVAAAGGFSIARLWTDAREQFWVAFLRPGQTEDDGATR